MSALPIAKVYVQPKSALQWHQSSNFSDSKLRILLYHYKYRTVPFKDSTISIVGSTDKFIEPFLANTNSQINNVLDVSPNTFPSNLSESCMQSYQ